MDLSFSSLFSSMMVSTIGAGLLLFGKKTEKPLYMVVGLGMSVFPFFVTNVVAMWVVAVGLMIPLYVLRRSV